MILNSNKIFSIFVLLSACIFASGCRFRDLDNPHSELYRQNSKPTLFFIHPDTNEPMELTEANSPHRKYQHLIIVTHGWLSYRPWHWDMAMAIKERCDKKTWLCGYYDWQQKSKLPYPFYTTGFDRNVAGPVIGNLVTDNFEDIQHIHLIAHSTSVWMISEAAKIIANKTKASIHLTFLDAYIPLFWKEEDLADFSAISDVDCWVEHYLTNDFTLGLTGPTLTNAVNIDISKLDIGFNDHEFPKYWYHATITGRYPKYTRFKNKSVYNNSEKFQFGFCRSLEASKENYRANKTIAKPGTKVKISKPK